ncbi:MAG: hypothetical protein ABFC89_13700 [Methanospirillum sp.]
MAASKGMYLAYLFQALIAANGVIAFVEGQYQAMFTAILMFAATFVPYVAAQRLDIRFPWFVYFLIALSLTIHISGYVEGWYVTGYPYYDKAAHLISASSIALLGFLGAIFLDRYWRMNLTPLFIVFFTVTFGMALGGLWEIYEFTVDQLFGGSLAGPMQAGLADTMWDMIADLVGSTAVALVGILYFRRHRVDEIADSMDGHNRA